MPFEKKRHFLLHLFFNQILMKKTLVLLLLITANSLFSQEDNIELNREYNKNIFINSFKSSNEFTERNVIFSKGLDVIFKEIYFGHKTYGLLYNYYSTSNDILEQHRINEITKTISYLKKNSNNNLTDFLNKNGAMFIFFQFNSIYTYDNDTGVYQINYLIKTDDLKSLNIDFSEETLKKLIKKI